MFDSLSPLIESNLGETESFIIEKQKSNWFVCCFKEEQNSILFYILFFSDLIGFKTMVRMDGKIISRGFLWTIKSITNRENVALIELMRNLYLSISFRPFGLITMTVPPILLLLGWAMVVEVKDRRGF